MVARRLAVGSGRCGRVPAVGAATPTSARGRRRPACAGDRRSSNGGRSSSSSSAVGRPAARARTPSRAGVAPPGRTGPRSGPATPRTAPATEQDPGCGLRPPSDLWSSTQHRIINGGRPGLLTGLVAPDQPGHDLRLEIKKARTAEKENPHDPSIKFDVALFQLVGGSTEVAERAYSTVIATRPLLVHLLDAIRNLDQLPTMFPDNRHAQKISSRLKTEAASHNSP
jgi:hypothetical protein